MPQFSYKARRRSGEVVQGSLDVPDRPAALVQLERLGLFPVLVEAAKGSAPKTERTRNGRAPARSAEVLPPALRAFFQRKRRPKMQQLASYTQQLANLLHAGMPLTMALNSMSRIEARGIGQEITSQLKQDVMEGRGLSDAMARHPQVFSDLYVNMVRAGEQSGALEGVLRRLATHYERFAEVQSKFVSALIYPALVITVGVAIMFFFMTYMLPKFLSIFEGLNVPLPAATRMLIGISHIFSGYWWLMLILIITAVVVFNRFQASEAGRRQVDHWKMNLPIFGKVVQLNLFGQFSRTLSTLLHNGVPVLTALKITEQTMPNVILREAIAQTREGVTDGKTIAQPLGRSGVFPQLMIDLLKIGEETGDVPGTLANVADTYENELTVALRVMMNLIEPIMIILMACGVGFLLFSVLSAMFAVTSSLGQR